MPFALKVSSPILLKCIWGGGGIHRYVATFRPPQGGPPQGGALMTLSEAREVLVHRTLCPGEDRWAAVFVDNHQAEVIRLSLFGSLVNERDILCKRN